MTFFATQVVECKQLARVEEKKSKKIAKAACKSVGAWYSMCVDRKERSTNAAFLEILKNCHNDLTTS